MEDSEIIAAAVKAADEHVLQALAWARNAAGRELTPDETAVMTSMGFAIAALHAMTAVRGYGPSEPGVIYATPVRMIQ